MLKPLKNLLHMLALLRLYLVLGVEPEGEADPEPDVEDDPAPDAEGEAESESSESEAEAESEAEPTPREGRANKEIREQRERAQTEREARIRAEALLEAERARHVAPARADPTFEQEEQRLRQLDLNTHEGRSEKWQIESNRVLRGTEQRANATLFQAQDMYDRSSFEGFMRTDHPGLMKVYSAKVEEKLAEARKNGGNPNRLLVFKLLLGEDALNGKLKGAAKQAGATGVKKPAVARGQSPGARSDVQRGRSTSHQKLEARLTGKNI